MAPAALEHRLAMMERFSGDIGDPGVCSNVAIGITPFAKFIDKAAAIVSSFPQIEEQVYITGYDTLVRLLDAK